MTRCRARRSPSHASGSVSSWASSLRWPSTWGGATASNPDQPGFESADHNKDGFVDKSEARVVPGLSANFERADRNRDGKLDAGEFEKGLQILQVRR